MKPHPWDHNEYGLWCSACGNHIARSDQADSDNYTPPDTCRECGFPDFENGFGYFTDEDEDGGVL